MRHWKTAWKFSYHNEHVFLDFEPGVYLSCADVAVWVFQIIRRHRPVAANHDTAPRHFDNEDIAGACVLEKLFSC